MPHQYKNSKKINIPTVLKLQVIARVQRRSTGSARGNLKLKLHLSDGTWNSNVFLINWRQIGKPMSRKSHCFNCHLCYGCHVIKYWVGKTWAPKPWKSKERTAFLLLKHKCILLILELRNVITNPRQQFIKSRKTANQKNVSLWEDVVGKFYTRSTRCCTWHVHFLNISSYEASRESSGWHK